MVNRPPTVNGRGQDSARHLGGYGTYLLPDSPGPDAAAQQAETTGPGSAQPGVDASVASDRPAAPPRPADTATPTTAQAAPPQHSGVTSAGTGAPASTYATAQPPNSTGTAAPTYAAPVPPSSTAAYPAHTTGQAQPRDASTAVGSGSESGASAAREAASEAAGAAEHAGRDVTRWSATGELEPEVTMGVEPIGQRSEPAGRVEVISAAQAASHLLAEITATNRATLRASTGVRGALNKVGFRFGLSPAEQRAEDRRNRIRRQIPGTYQIAVISVKGGVGRTTTAATLGSTFASIRYDRVVAVDANPDFSDLGTRTVRHPYGLTLRDLAQARDLRAFSAVQAYTTTNNANLVVVASPWATDATRALNGDEYAAAVQTLRVHYNLVVVDCGTGVFDSATGGVLASSDAALVVTPATVGGVTGAVATLNWLAAHGLERLVHRSSVAIVHQHPVKPNVDVAAIEQLFATAERPTYTLPYDPHLAEGGEIDLRLLHGDTVLAFEELAAALSDGFPTFRGATR
ncbi:Cell division inhibitor MinD [Nocardia otitidiscaviarum]|uniref:Cell division inhibitor MinD n=1 Tax=Nocardia otitidiscaviarum TaxID=1823 RepID=A0A378Y7F8_9NOCA|nr:MinD/ParA family protein [Nocardia otitidiscaviarum]SUA72798.1 Cell division inhibitor MinD [Nocardia otitidiscaviarum]